jgi:myo-inositol-1(or 4)-monophosphatase
MCGSSARLLTYVAEGKFDVAVEYHDHPWDFAAGVCLIEEAGGVFNDLRGKSPTYQTVGYIAAAPQIHSKVFELISG